MAGIKWTPEQEAIHAAMAKDGPNLMVRAVAGSGKTATVVGGAAPLPEGSWFSAFNRSAANQVLAPRLLAAGSRCRAKTLHSLGFALVREAAAAEGIRVSVVNDKAPDAKVRELLAKVLPEPQNRRERMALYDAVKLVGLCKAWLVDGSERDVLEALCADHALDFGRWHDRVLDSMLSVLMDCQRLDYVDFDDMVWLPAVMGLEPKVRAPVGIVDEAQDMSACQHKLVCSLADRLIFVGDPAQCIPAGEPVLTPDGPVPIEKLGEGDVVMAPKAGRFVPQVIRRKSSVRKSKCYRFDLGKHGTFRATAEHICFAALDDPTGAWLYLMWRADRGFRLGVTQVSGSKAAENLRMRTLQEGGERLWVLGWFPTYGEAAEQEEFLSLEYAVPTLPFRSRPDSWSDETTARIFEAFGQNGKALVEKFALDFERPNYIPKASGAEARVAVNILMGTKDGARVEVETRHVEAGLASRLGMRPSKAGCWRTRRTFRTLREARACAAHLAERLEGYVVEHLSGVGGINRRMMAVPASQVHIGMAVPVVGKDGRVTYAKVLARTEEPAATCYDLEVDLGTFVVGNAVVHNSLYRFRGADNESMDRLATELSQTDRGVETLPLTVNWRCGKAHIALAQRLVPEIKAHDGAVEGAVGSADEDEVFGKMAPGWVGLCRTNAPLMGPALAMLRRGQRAVIRGRDFGAGLEKMVAMLEPADVADLIAKSWEYQYRESDRLRATRYGAGKISALEDRCEALRALVEGCATLNEVHARLNALFSDRNENGAVVFSTVHRFKGDEAPHIAVLSPELMPHPRAGEADIQTELNVMYVTVTRPKESLTWLGAPPPYFDVAEVAEAEVGA